MNSVEKISRLQTLLTRVQTRAKEPRQAAPMVTAPPTAPVAITPPAAAPKISQPEPVLRPAAVFTPAATSVSTDTTLPFAAQVAPELIARAGMKSPLGSEPPVARIEAAVHRTEPAPALTRESAPPEIEVAESEETISETPGPKVVEVVSEPAKAAQEHAAAMSDLDFADLETPEEQREAVKPAEAEPEAPPASSKRPSLHARAPEPEVERPITTPPESGPQEVSAAELAAAAKAEPLEVDLALKQAPVPHEATIEQLGNTVELEAATEEALELAPPAAPVVRKVEPAGEMEAEIPASVPPGVYAPDVAHLRVEPAQKPAAEKQLELEELGPASERAPEPSAEPKKPEVAVEGKPEGRAEEAVHEPITAVRMIVPAARAEPVPVTIDVRPVATKGAVLEAEAAAFVGAVREFEPGTFLDLLDASLSLSDSPSASPS